MIELTGQERAVIAEMIRRSGQKCLFASNLYRDGQMIYCSDKPEEQVGPRDAIQGLAIGIDRTGKPTFRPVKQ